MAASPLSPGRPLREGDTSFDFPAPSASRSALIPDLLWSHIARLRRMAQQQWRSWGLGGHGTREGGPEAGERGEGGHELHRPSLEQRVVVVGNPKQTLSLAGGSHIGQGSHWGTGGLGALRDALKQLLVWLAQCVGVSAGSLSDNSICTGKYTLLTFLPRNLFEQFHRVAYIYFLALILVNQIPVLAVFGRFLSLVPLLSVLTVTAIKDAYRRHPAPPGRPPREQSPLPALGRGAAPGVGAQLCT